MSVGSYLTFQVQNNRRNPCMVKFPLPVITISVLCGISLLLFVFDIWGRLSGSRFGISMSRHRKGLKIFFFSVLLLNLLLTVLVFLFYRTELYNALPIALGRTADVLVGEEQFFASKSYFVDFLSACATVFAAFAALVIGLRAMLEKITPLNSLKACCILLVIASVEGVYYSNSLYSIFFFIIMSQFASLGLYRHAAMRSGRAINLLLHHLSRIVAMLLLAAGIILLSARYSPSVVRLISTTIKAGVYEKIAFSLIFAPLLAFFLRPVSHTVDPVYRAFFAMRSQAVFFVILRIVFSMFGVCAALEKVPNIMIFTGCITLLLSVLMMITTKEPEKCGAYTDLFAKGFLVAVAGIGYYGCFSAEGVAQYGFTALECLIALWLLYLPLSAALSAAVALFEREDENGVKLYRKSGLMSLIPIAVLTLFFALFCFCGMPPFATYPFMQLTYRSATFVMPALATFLVIAVIAMFFIGLYVIASMAFGKAWTTDDKEKSSIRDSEMALPAIILMLWIAFFSFFPGLLIQQIAAPSVEAMLNTGYSINVIEGAEK